MRVTHTSYHILHKWFNLYINTANSVLSDLEIQQPHRSKFEEFLVTFKPVTDILWRTYNKTFNTSSEIPPFSSVNKEKFSWDKSSDIRPVTVYAYAVFYYIIALSMVSKSFYCPVDTQ